MPVHWGCGRDTADLCKKKYKSKYKLSILVCKKKEGRTTWPGEYEKEKVYLYDEKAFALFAY